MAILRSFIFLDQLQPQTMCYLGSWIKGSLPRRNMAAQIIECDRHVLVLVAETKRSVFIFDSAEKSGPTLMPVS